MLTNFHGYERLKRNYDETENRFIDSMSCFTGSEFKIMLFLSRYTGAYQRKTKRNSIYLTIDEIINGRLQNDGTRMCSGTGCSASAIEIALNRLVRNGHLRIQRTKERKEIKYLYTVIEKLEAE